MEHSTERTFSIQSWILLTFYGWVSGCIIYFLLEAFIVDMYTCVGISFGICIGYFQWMYLRKIMHMTIKWLAFSILGMTIPVIFLLSSEISPYLRIFLIALSPLVASFLQTQLLRLHFRKAYLWTWGSFGSWAACVAFILGSSRLISSLTNTYNEGKFVFILIIIVTGLVLGSLTGIIMKSVLTSQRD